jgi:serine/threonine-protein kinase
VIGGRYELESLLGRGSFGAVWRAHHLSLGEDVAIKLLAQASSSVAPEDPATASARFLFEAQIAARLSRKTRHIVRVTDHGEEDDGLAYLVMELLEGCTLEKRLLVGGEMATAEVARLVAQMARALECAHAERVVHRDLKPANVFLARDEDGELLVKVLDFGIARATRTQRRAVPFSTGHGVVFGTPGYMSPEQTFGGTLDARADLWALATVAYEGLTGELPLPGVHVHELLRHLRDGRLVPVHQRNDRLPAGLARFFERAFAPRIEDRFASASELASAFEQSIAGRVDGCVRMAPSPEPSLRRAETLPMAVASTPRSTPARRRSAWPWVALGSAIALPPLVAAAVLRKPPIAGATPATSTAVPTVRLEASTIAQRREPSAGPASSPAEVVSPSGPTGAARPAPRPVPRPTPPLVGGPAAISATTSSPSGVPTPAPARSPSTEPAHAPIDRSAIL